MLIHENTYMQFTCIYVKIKLLKNIRSAENKLYRGRYFIPPNKILTQSCIHWRSKSQQNVVMVDHLGENTQQKLKLMSSQDLEKFNHSYTLWQCRNKKMRFSPLIYGGILLPLTRKINYVNMRLIYVNMQHNYVNMQHNYVDMQHNSSSKLTCLSRMLSLHNYLACRMLR